MNPSACVVRLLKYPGGILKHTIFCLALSLMAATAGLPAQQMAATNDNAPTPIPAPDGGVMPGRSVHEWTPGNSASAPFSRIAFGGGVSAMGINMQAAVIANRYINLRGTGNFFNYSLNNVSINGLNLDGTVGFATAGTSVDFYPFPNHGFRVSPGAMFYNHNQVTATVVAPGGTSFSLDGYTYYSSQANPVTGNGSVGLNKQNPAFTITTGWGNMIPRSGGHWSFPFEVGAAFVGSPTVNLALTSGQVCSNSAGTVGCMNVVGNSQISTNLQAEVTKYQNALNPLRFYPIFSTGVSFSFGLHHGEASPVALSQSPALP
jgi:hypothetical protein